MNPSETSPSSSTRSEFAPAVPPVSADVAQALMSRPPKVVTVMCPAGFTNYAAEGLTIDQPLFARVTFRP